MKYDEKQRRIIYEDQLKEYERSGGRMPDYYRRRRAVTLRESFVIGLWGMAFTFGMFTLAGLEHAYRVEARPDWSSVQGVVVSSYIVSTPGTKGSVSRCSHISYEYVINGEKYSGENIELYRYCVDISYVEEHPKNSQIAVFFDPKNVSHSALVVDYSLAKLEIMERVPWFALFLLLGILFSKKSGYS